MTVEEFQNSKGKLHCKQCDSLDLYIKKVPPHLGVYCNTCDKWNGWLKQTSEGTSIPEQPLPPIFQAAAEPIPNWGPPPQEVKPPRYTPNQISHPQTLEERVASLEHDIRILAQLMLGKRRDG